MKPSLPLPFVVLLCVVSCCCVVSTSGVFAAAHEPHVDASLRGAPAKPSGVGPASPASSVLATNARSRAEFEALITKAGCDAIEFQRVGTQVDTDGAPVERSGYLDPILLADRCVGCGLCETRWFRINARHKRLLADTAIHIVAGPGKKDRLVQGSYRTGRETGHPDKPDAGAPAGTTNDAYLPAFPK